MRLKNITKIIFLFCCIVTLLACGSGGGSTSSNGTLSPVTQIATDNTDGTFTVTASATYTPPVDMSVLGATISFVTQISANGVVQSTINNSNKTVDSNGTASISPLRIAQSNEPLYVSTTAYIGDLNQTAFLTIPLINTVLTPSPSVVSFIQVDPAGGQSPFTISLSGGFLPYTIVSNDRPTDIDVKLNSSTLTVSKLVASGTTSVSTFATITISDRRGTTTTVRVNYFR